MDFNGNVTAATVLSMGTGTHTFAKDLTASTSLNFVTDGTATFDGTSAQTITGAITTTIASGGNIIVSNTGGTVTFTDLIGVSGANDIGDITTAASSTVVFNSGVHADAISQSGTVTYNGLSSLDANLTLADGAKIIVGSDIADAAVIITSAGNVIDAGTITIEMPSQLADGNTVTLFDTNAGTVDAIYSVTDTALFDYTATLDDTAKTVVISMAKRSTAAIASNLGVSSSVGAALSSANTAVSAAGDATALAALNVALNAGGATAKKAAETMAVQSDTLGGGATASMGAGGQVNSVASSRMAMMRSGAQYAGVASETGFNTGGHGMSNAAWMKPFGNWMDQDKVTENGAEIAGFTAETYGLSAGVDTEVSDNVRLGGSLSYSQSEVEGEGAGKSKIDVDSYQLTLYGDYTTAEYYIEGTLGYAMNENNMSRSIQVATLLRTAKGTNDSSQYMASIRAGMPIHLDNATFITPSAGVSYTQVQSDNYTETGAGNLNLTVKPEDIESLILNASLKVHTRIKQGKGFLIPTVHAGLSYDTTGDSAVATANFTGGGASFKSTGADPEQLGANAGLGITYDDGAWSVGAGYDLSVKDGFAGHSGSVEARWKF
jgi:uncharacterized protein with beta-barrel porin domain